MNITQRQITYIALGFQLAATVISWIFNVLDSGLADPLTWAAEVGVLIYSVLLIAYWRGWEYARHTSVILITLLIVVVLPEPFVTTYAPFLILLGPILALVLVGPLWVIGSAVATIGLLLLRAGGVGIYASPTTLLSYAMLIAGLIISRVITERARTQTEQAEDALRASEARKAAILESALDCIITIDHQGHILEFNPAAEATFGYSRTEALGREMAELIIPASLRDQHRRGLAEYLVAKEGHILGKRIELTGLRADGSEFPVELNITRMAEDEPPVFTGFLRDITDRKRAEQQLRESEERFSKTFYQNPVGIVLTDLSDNTIRDVNDAFLKMMGLTREEIVGQNVLQLSIQVDPGTRAAINRELQEHGSFKNKEVRLQRPGGEIRDVLDSGALITVGGKPHHLGLLLDITDRKRVEEKLRLSDQILQRVNTLVLVADAQGDIIYISPAVKIILGYEPEELLGDKWWKISRSESAEAQREKEYVGRAAAGEIPIEDEAYERLVQDKGGNTHWISWVDAAGPGNTLIGVGHDITERKQAEEALVESEALYRLAIETAGAVPYREVYPDVNDERIEYQFIGEGIRQITGYGPEEFNASVWESITLEMHPRDDLAEYPTDEAIHRVRSGKEPRWKCDFKIRARDGTIHWVFESAVELRDEHGISHGSIGMYQDITERKQAEQALQEAKDFAEKVVQTANVMFVQLDIAGNIQKFNSAAEEITGYSLSEVLGRNWGDTLVPRQRYPNAWKEFDRLLGAGETRKSFENPVLTKRGEERQILWKNSLIHEGDKIAGVISFGIDITERQNAEEKIQRQIRHLSALHEIDLTISGSVDMRVTLDVFLTQVVSQLNVDAAAILLFHPHMLTLEYAAGRGFRSQATREAQLKVDESYAGLAVFERHIVHLPNFMETGAKFVQSRLLADEDFIDYYGIPLLAKGQVKGVLEIFHRSLLTADPDWLDFLATLGGQAAIAIDNAQLFDSLQRSNTDLTLAYDATIEGWSRAMDLRDKETEGHTLRVTDLTLKLAYAMRVGRADLVHVRRGALLHDIGKLGVPDNILLKPDKLSEEEWEIMRKHPTHAYEMLAAITYLRPALDIPYAHHEKWDGTGYPRGLKGEQIPLVARIFAIVDVWDAITSDRPYRPAWTKKKALKHIKEGSGKHFDPQVVEAFLKMIAH